MTTFHDFVFFSTVYACGLRLQEALSIQITDIDSKRMMLYIHRGKGAKDRYVPIPQETLPLLRQYWKTQRNPTLLFPALGRGHTGGPTATVPMNRASVQGINIRTIQRYMGHKSLETTTRSLHLTRKGQEDAYQIIDSFMTGFSYDRS